MCINWLNLNLLIVVSVLKESFGNPIARNLGHGTPRAVTRGNLKTDQLNHNRLLYYGANYVKITTK